MLGGANDLESKWLQFITPGDARAELVFDLGQSVPVVAYQLYTANDFYERDPAGWDVYYRQDSGAWIHADAVLYFVMYPSEPF